MTYKGLDVSNVPSYQRNITLATWKKIKAAGYSFVIIKAGGSDDGFYKDAVFEKNYKNAKSAGLNVGAYYVVGKSFTSESVGKEHAKKFIDILKGKQFEYPVYLDIESMYFSAKNKKANTDACVAFIKTLQSAGYWTGIYASTVSGFQNVLDDSRLQPYAHWVAEYNGEDKCSYKGKVGVGIWQYTSSGKVPGINGNVDLDISYVDYPTKIKAKGMNGFTKTTTTVKAPTATTSKSGLTLRKEMVALAQSYVGCVRGDSKHKEIIDIFNTVQPDGWPMNYTAAWCAAFVSALAIKKFGKDKAKKFFPLSANCKNIIKNAKAKGIWVENDAYIPSPGDWIIYDWEDDGVGEDSTGYDHVGLVKASTSTKITAIEGNISNKCGTRVINVNGRYIRGFVHPDYESLAAGEALTPTVVKYKVAITGVWDQYTTKMLAVKLKVNDDDGVIKNQLNSCKKYLVAIDNAKWRFSDNPVKGSDIIVALQKKVGVKADGWIGPDTIAALQTFLNKNLGLKLDVDSYLGVQTVKAFQTWINK